MSHSERDPNEINRGWNLEGYISELHGKDQLFDYIEQLAAASNSQSVLLDIGTGSGLAASQIAEERKGWKVLGIDRVTHPEVEAMLGENFQKADASQMVHILDGAVHGILAVNSIAYATPEELIVIASEI